MLRFERTPDFDEFRQVLLRRGEPQRVPFYELFADVEIMEAILGRSIQNGPADILEFQLTLGYDYVMAWIGNLHFAMKGLETAPDTAQLSRGERTYRVANMKTITSWEDFETYPWPDPTHADYSQIETYARLMPEGMRVLVPAGHMLEDPIGLLGYEGLSYLMADDPQLVDAVFARVGEIYEKVYRDCSQMDAVGGLIISDDLGFKTGTMISPMALRRWVFPWYRRFVDVCHSNDKPVILHSCGNLIEVMDDIIDCGIDAKHSFEDQIMPVTEAKRIYGDRIAVLGGVDLDFLCRATEAEVRRRTREILEECMPGGGYALGTGNSVSNYVPIENYLAMLDEGAQVGVYHT